MTDARFCCWREHRPRAHRISARGDRCKFVGAHIRLDHERIASSQGVSHIRLEPGGNVTTLTGISGALLSDFVLHSDGNVYAVGSDFASRSFVYGSTDGVDFVRLIDVNDLRFGPVGNNADGRPSLASFGGELYFGSSTNGTLYRLD